MKKKRCLASLLVAGLTAASLPVFPAVSSENILREQPPANPPEPKNAGKMNYLFFLADDLGYMDIAVNGSTYYETPNLQRLAAKGTTFTNAYANPVCSPSRSALLSGQYAHRTMFNAPSGHWADNSEGFASEGRFGSGTGWCQYGGKNSLNALPTDMYTIGQAFKDHGYRTGFIGKAHIGTGDNHRMSQYGFEYDMGMQVPGPRSYYEPYFHANQKGNPWDTGDLKRSGEHLTDRLAREADAYITKCAEAGEAFFLELWDFSVHAPFEAKKEYVEYFRNKQVPDSPQNGCYQMAAMVKTMDDAVGKVMDSLERNGIADHTVVVFMGDNGGNSHSSVNGCSVTNNYPLRQGKGTIYEGGIRVPCIVYAPGVSCPGSVVHENIHAVDFYPTLLDLAGITLDSTRLKDANNPYVIDRTQILDGMSLVPLLNGSQTTLDRPGVFTNYLTNDAKTGQTASAAVNSGDWKLIVNYSTLGGRKAPYELYNLKEDISEVHNLADQYPEKVEELRGYIDAHQSSIPQALPRRNINYHEESETPTGYLVWLDWLEDFRKKVESDPDVKNFPKVVIDSPEKTFFEKAHEVIIARVGSKRLLDYGFDCRTRGAFKQTGDEYFLAGEYFGENVFYINVRDKNLKAFPYNGFVALGEEDPHFTESEVLRANACLDSFEQGAVAPWKPESTTPMYEVRSYAHPPKGLGEAAVTWNFADGTQKWSPDGLEVRPVKDGICMTMKEKYSTITSPVLSIDADRVNLLHVRYENLTEGMRMNVKWITQDDPVYDSSKMLTNIPIFHNREGLSDWYIFLGNEASWTGTVTGIRIEPSMDAVSGTVRYETVELMEVRPEVRWDFRDGLDGWTEENGRISCQVKDGILECQIRGDGAYIVRSPLNIRADRYRGVRIRYKNTTDSSKFQVYYKTDVHPGIIGQFKNFSLKTHMTDFEEVFLPMSDVPKWDNILTFLRLDVADTADEGWVYIDYIELVPVA